MSETKADIQADGVPFSIEERHELREMMRKFREVEASEVVELKRLAQGGKAFRLIVSVLGRIIVLTSGAFGLFAVFRQFFGKGAG